MGAMQAQAKEWLQDSGIDPVLLERCAQIVLAAIEVGPHIKPVKVRSGVPLHVVSNASYYLRQAGVWERWKVAYQWLHQYKDELPEALDGIQLDAGVAAGYLAVEYKGGQRSYRPRSISDVFGGHLDYDFGDVPWSDLIKRTKRHWPTTHKAEPCGTKVALMRHRQLGEICLVCQESATDRRIVRGIELQTLRERVRQERAERLKPKPQDELAWERYRALQQTELAAQQFQVIERQLAKQERAELRRAGLVIPRPRVWSLDWEPSTSDRLDRGTGAVERLVAYRQLDPVGDIVAEQNEYLKECLAICDTFAPLPPMPNIPLDQITIRPKSVRVASWGNHGGPLDRGQPKVSYSNPGLNNLAAHPLTPILDEAFALEQEQNRAKMRRHNGLPV